MSLIETFMPLFCEFTLLIGHIIYKLYKEYIRQKRVKEFYNSLGRCAFELVSTACIYHINRKTNETREETRIYQIEINNKLNSIYKLLKEKNKMNDETEPRFVGLFPN